MNEPTRVSIIGLGLMGGSLAAALQDRKTYFVVGYDLDPLAARAAKERGYVDEVANTPEEAVADVDVVVLAAPVRVIIRQLKELALAMAPGTTVIDLGSTKGAIVEAMARLPDRLGAMGGHPMCGKRTSGVDGASAHLYQGRTFVVVPTARTDERARQRMANLVEAIGARPVEMAADEHDRVVARISHLPHFASVPALETAREVEPLSWKLAAGGFKNFTMAAEDNLPMWKDIALTNGPEIGAALRAFASHVQELAESFERGDAEEVDRLLTAAAVQYRSRLGEPEGY